MELDELSKLSYSLGVSIFHTLWQGFLAGLLIYLLLLVIPKFYAKLRFIIGYILILAVFVLFVGNIVYSLNQNLDNKYINAIAFGDGINFIHHGNQNPNNNLLSMFQSRLLDVVIDNSFLICVFWIGGVVFSYLRLFKGVVQINKLKKHYSQHVPPEWEGRFIELLQKLQLSREVMLKASGKINMPITFGWLKPVVLLPASLFTMLTPEQIEFIILHELAHIKRNDYLLNIIKSIIQSFLFFHPIVWWAAIIIEKEREKACDDIVLNINKDPLTYIKALTAVAEYGNINIYSAMAILGHRQDLSSRIYRIVNLSTLFKMNSPTQTKSQLIAGLLCIVFLLSGVGISIASKKENLTGVAIKPLEYHLRENKKAFIASGFNTNQTPENVVSKEDTTKKKKGEEGKVETAKINNMGYGLQGASLREVQLDNKESIILTVIDTSGTNKSLPIHTVLSGNIVIRGEDNKKILYILNETVIDEAEFKTIAPVNIVAIEVYKDKSAIKRYGAQGINGVVKVITKANAINEIKLTNGAGSSTIEPGERKENIIEKRSEGAFEAKNVNSDLIESRVEFKANAVSKTNGEKDGADIIKFNTKPFAETQTIKSQPTIYPNPATNTSVIEVEMEEQGPLHVELLDINGNKKKDLFKSNNAQGKLRIGWDASLLEKGTYIIKINKGDVTSQQRVIID